MCVISVGRLWVLAGFESQPGEFEFHIGLWLGSSPGTWVQILLHGFKSQSQVDSFSSSSVQFSRSVVSDSLRPHEPQHAKPGQRAGFPNVGISGPCLSRRIALFPAGPGKGVAMAFTLGRAMARALCSGR